MRNSGPGSQPVESPPPIPEQAHLQSSVVASDPICRHPGCTEITASGRARYCEEHGKDEYAKARVIATRKARQAAGIPTGFRHCDHCGVLFRKSGRNQRYCRDHMDVTKHGSGVYRSGAVYVPEGMTYAAFAAEVTATGVSMNTYARRRRAGMTHDEAMAGRGVKLVERPRTRPTLYPPTPEQVLANGWLRKSFFKHAVFSAAEATRYPSCGSGEIVQPAPPAAVLAQI